VQLSIEKADGKRIGLDWSTGLVFGQAQNLARELMETPANLMTPTLFCERIKKEFQGIKNVDIQAHEKCASPVTTRINSSNVFLLFPQYIRNSALLGS
jgi:hypothetical protein